MLHAGRWSDMALFPLVSNFENDFVIQLLPVDTDDTMDQVAEKAAFHSVARRMWELPEGTVLRVREQDAPEPLARDTTVLASGLGPMACIVVYAE
jgi:toluene monooxygenase system protein B